jgi:hypothetical protein
MILHYIIFCRIKAAASTRNIVFAVLLQFPEVHLPAMPDFPHPFHDTIWTDGSNTGKLVLPASAK